MAHLEDFASFLNVDGCMLRVHRKLWYLLSAYIQSSCSEVFQPSDSHSALKQRISSQTLGVGNEFLLSINVLEECSIRKI